MVSLFPFLSVLACVIGTLTLLLAAIAVGRLGGPSLEGIRLAEQFEALREIVAAGQAKLEALEAQLRRSEEEAESADEIGRRMAALGLSPEISLEDLTALVDLAQESAELDARASRLDRTRARLKGRVSADEQTYSARRETRDAAPIIIEPSGVGRQWVPFLIECTADYIEYYDAGDNQSARIPTEEMALGRMLPRIMLFIRSVPGSIAIFLIRPNGVETCQRARQLADRHRVRSAELPLPGMGPLDLSRMSDGD